MRLNKLMSAKFLGGFVASLFIAGVAQADEQVLCIPTKNVLVYDTNLKTIVFSGDQYETLVPFQGWGDVKKTVKIKGKKETFVKVQFVDRQEEDAENDIGWVRESQVKASSKCPGYRNPNLEDDEKVSDDFAEKFETTFSAKDDSDISLSNPNCCRFPLASSAHASYTSGAPKFGWGRGPSRKHAAADLYHRQYEPVYAVADGEVIRDRTYFYNGTSSTEVRHGGANGFVARYGEIASSTQKTGLEVGATVKAGQLIGYIKATTKKVGFNPPMLHFELYTGKMTGSLTPPKGTVYPSATWSSDFKRRKDLLNPTSYLQKWEGRR